MIDYKTFTDLELYKREALAARKFFECSDDKQYPILKAAYLKAVQATKEAESYEI
jgi:hypothetical protein